MANTTGNMQKCGMIYTNPQPDVQTLQFYYEKYLRFGESSALFSKERVQFLKKNANNSFNTILEIGAFDGTFLNLVKNEGFKVFGLEPSPEGVEKAEKKYGLNLEKAFFNEEYVKGFLKSGNNKFDIVCFFHVYEHIQNPINFLNLVTKITKPDGIIFIEVPDAQKPFANNIADSFSIEHIMYYTETSFRNIAGILGLELVEIEKPHGVIRVIFKNSNLKPTYKITNEYENNKSILEKYKKYRKKFLNSIKEKLEGLKNIVIYGAGMHTSQMIQEGLLNDINIEYIVDSDPKKWGSKFFNYIVMSPEILKNCKYSVLISSYDSQEEISSYLLNEFPSIKQVKLYNNVISYNKGDYSCGKKN